MTFCRRCGEEINLKKEFCPICGLYREGGKGKLSVTNETERYKLKKIELRDIEILEINKKLEDHEILKYYSLENLTKEKIDSEVTKLSNQIKSQDKNPINPNNHFYLQKRNKRKKIEEQLHIVFDYIVLQDIKELLENISKFYDIRSLTQIKIKSEKTRLKEDIKILDEALQFLEEKDKDNQYKIDLYLEREFNKAKFNILNHYLELENLINLNKYRKDDELIRIYGKLPNWRIEKFEKRGF